MRNPRYRMRGSRTSDLCFDDLWLTVVFCVRQRVCFPIEIIVDKVLYVFREEFIVALTIVFEILIDVLTDKHCDYSTIIVSDLLI